MIPDPLSRLNDVTLIALRFTGDQWPRGLLSTKVIPDAWMALVETDAGYRRFAPAGEDPRPGARDTLTFVRNRLITVPLELATARSADGHEVAASAELLVRWPARDEELAALARALQATNELALDALARQIAEHGGNGALRDFLQARGASELVDGDHREALHESLRAALKGVLYEYGSLLDRVATLRVTSRSLIEQRARERDTQRQVTALKTRQMVEQAALEATHQRLDSLTGILDKLNAAAATSEGVEWQELLPALSPAERGRLLENLWRITPNRRVAKRVVAVCGQELAWLEPTTPDRIERRVALPEDLGGCRSVTFAAASGRLYVGAAQGVWEVTADVGEVVNAYPVPDAAEQRTGFNAAAVADGQLYATHSGLGCWMWPLDAPLEAVPLLEPTDGRPRTLRAVLSDGDKGVFFSGDNRVYCVDPAGECGTLLEPLGDVIHALATLDRRLYAGLGDGTVVACDLDAPRAWETVHRGVQPIESLQVRRWGDLVELVLPEADHGVRGIYAQESISTTLLAGGAAIRRAWCCDDLVLGLSAHRDRLFILSVRGAEQFPQEVPLARMLGRSIQDACLVEEYTGPQLVDGAPTA